MWSANFLLIDHVSVSPTDGIGSTQGQRKTLTRVGIEPTTFGFDYHCSSDWATRSDGSRSWEMKMSIAWQWIYSLTHDTYKLVGDSNITKKMNTGVKSEPKSKVWQHTDLGEALRNKKALTIKVFCTVILVLKILGLINDYYCHGKFSYMFHCHFEKQ